MVNKGKKIDPDLSGFSQPAGLRVRSIPPVLFQVFSPVGHVRRTSGGLDHRISVVVMVAIGGHSIVTSGSGCGGSRCGCITADGAGISASTASTVDAVGDGGYAVVGSGSSAFGVGDTTTTTTVVVVSVGYDYGIGGTIGSVAVGPPEHSQHNIRSKGYRNFLETAAVVTTRKWSVAVYRHPPSVNETSTKPSNGQDRHKCDFSGETKLPRPHGELDRNLVASGRRIEQKDYEKKKQNYSHLLYRDYLMRP